MKNLWNYLNENYVHHNCIIIDIYCVLNAILLHWIAIARLILLQAYIWIYSILSSNIISNHLKNKHIYMQNNGDKNSSGCKEKDAKIKKKLNSYSQNSPEKNLTYRIWILWGAHIADRLCNLHRKAYRGWDAVDQPHMSLKSPCPVPDVGWRGIKSLRTVYSKVFHPITSGWVGVARTNHLRSVLLLIKTFPKISGV